MKTLLTSLFLGLGTLQAAQHAVIATVNDYPGTMDDLKGCHADGNAVERMLRGRFGFPAANIIRLRDAEVTTAALRRAIAEHLVAKCRPGDAAVFFYSGHGTQVPDLDGDERDGADEALYTADASAITRESWFTDDVLRAELAGLRTNRLTVILECCHSGTGTRGMDSDAAEGEKYLDLGFGRAAGLHRNLGISAAMKALTANPHHVLLAACASHETAREDGAQGGRFRVALEKQLAEQGDALPLEKLYEPLRRDLARQTARGGKNRLQTPQIEGNARLSLRALLGPEVPADSPLARPAATAPSMPDTPRAGPGILLATDKTDYTVGERLTVRLKLARDAHLRLYYTDAEHHNHLIFPNRYHPDDRVKAGEEIQLPGPGAGYAFEMTYPHDLNRGPVPTFVGGNARPAVPVCEILTAVASPSPFTDRLDWNNGPFLDYAGTQHEVTSRGLDTRSALPPEKATVIYRVHPKKP